MRKRSRLSRQAFHLGLAFMLGMAILSAVVGPGYGPLTTGLAMLSAVVALLARLWKVYIHRADRGAALGSSMTVPTPSTRGVSGTRPRFNSNSSGQRLPSPRNRAASPYHPSPG